MAGAAALVLRPMLLPYEVEGQREEATNAPAQPAKQAAIPPGLAEALAPNKPTADGPAFDIARIDPNGTSVFAGRGEPGTVVTVMADGVALGTAKVDTNGEWTFVTERQVAREAKLALSAAPDTGPKRIADAGPNRNEAPSAPAAGKENSQRKEPEAASSAEGITKQFLKNLEVMVAAARDAEKNAADAKTKTDAPAADSPAAPATGGPAQSLQASPPPPAQPAPERHAERAPPPVTAPAIPVAPAPTTASPSPGPANDAGRAVSIPVPVLFVYNDTAFTPEGSRAVKLLLEYLLLKRFDSVTLSGHADERGTDLFNMELSRQRLDAVAQVLRDGGFTGRLNLLPKGKSEPFTGVDRTRLSREDLYQLDRRVELRITQ